MSATFVQATVITVSNANDSGVGTLRQAMLDASSGDTINFAAGISTINLTSGELLIRTNLTINGPGPNLLTVQRSSGINFYIFDVASANVTATISGLTAADGSSTLNGGDIYNTGSLTISNCIITGGAANFGSGIYNNGLITINNSTITGNGSSMYVNYDAIDNLGRATISNSTISGNAAGGVASTGTLTINNSTISGNKAYGGITSSGTATIINSTIYGNTLIQPNDGGGGIENGGTMTINDSTISSNSAPMGGGIYNSEGTVTLNNTIIALNTAPYYEGPDVLGTITSQGFNLIGNSNNATIISAQSTDKIGTTAAPINPLLGPLQNNGGPTFTCALLSGSPAIDAGDDSVLGSPLNLTTDQRGVGFPRKIGSHVDIGAFEFGNSAPQLTITISGANAILTWPTNAVGFNLLFTANLGSLAVWNTNTAGPIIIGGQNLIIDPISGTRKFYRLSQ